MTVLAQSIPLALANAARRDYAPLGHSTSLLCLHPAPFQSTIPEWVLVCLFAFRFLELSVGRRGCLGKAQGRSDVRLAGGALGAEHVVAGVGQADAAGAHGAGLLDKGEERVHHGGGWLRRGRR